MNFITGYLVYLPSVLAGGLFVHQLWPGNQIPRLLFKLGLGAGLGLGVTSLLTFLYLSLANRLSGFMVVQIILLISGLFLTWKNWKSNSLLPESSSLTRLQKILLAVFLGALVTMLSAYFLYALMTPTGRFDAWMIYNRAARFIYRDPTSWQNTLSPQMYWLFHADYPLLVPVNVAGAWNTLAGENMRAAQAQSAYFLIGIFCMLMGATTVLRTIGQGVLAGVILLGVPVFFINAAREEADIPLSFFMLATIALLFLYHREQKPALAALAGLSTGLAAWTKNEGLLFLISGSIAWMLLFLFQKKVGDLKWYVLGIALPLLFVLSFKLFFAPPNDLFETSTSLSARLADFARYPVILGSFLQQFFTFGNGKLGIFVLAIYGLVVRLEKNRNHRLPLIAAGLAVLVQLAGYFMIYVLTPHNLNWHLGSSLYRLILHIFPVFLLILFVSITDPETIFAEPQNPSISPRL